NRVTMRFQASRLVFLCCICAATLFLFGCGTYQRHGLDPLQAAPIEQALAAAKTSLSPELEDRILALDPEHVTGSDIRETLARAPAPRIIKIHGGIARVVPRMISFSEFLAGMGYPRAALTNVADGTCTFSCYESSEMIAG